MDKVTNLATMECINAVMDRKWLGSTTVGDYATPLPEGWVKHQKIAQNNKDHFTNLLREDSNIEVDVDNLSNLKVDQNSETGMFHLASKGGDYDIEYCDNRDTQFSVDPEAQQDLSNPTITEKQVIRHPHVPLSLSNPWRVTS